jgi:hypothetical protein
MTMTFAAKEREVAAAKPGEAPPAVDLGAFGYSAGTGSAMHREFVYATRKHSILDMVRPGYFDAARDFGLKLWDMIRCTVGDDPGTAVEVDLRVIEVPVSKQLPVLVAKGEARRFTPVRHDGTASGDATTKSKAA